VVEDDRQSDSASVTIPDPRMIFGDAIFEGSSMEVDLGYAEKDQHALMLRAIITKVESNFNQNGVPSLTLKGDDLSITMGLAEKRRVWRDRSVTDIVKSIANENGFKQVQVELNPDPMIRTRPIHQDGKTDLAFLQDLAKTYHAKCFVELDEHAKEVLYFIPERRILHLRRPDQLLLNYRMGPSSNLISFSPKFDVSYIDRFKEVHDIDPQGQKIQSQEKPQSESFIWNLSQDSLARASQEDKKKINDLYNKGVHLKQNLDQKLHSRQPAVGEVAADQAQLDSTNDALESRHLGMSASGSTYGNIWLRAKSKITVQGVGERFSGDWYVNNVTHKIDSSGYKTDFRCVR
jgi:phage protein D